MRNVCVFMLVFMLSAAALVAGGVSGRTAHASDRVLETTLNLNEVVPGTDISALGGQQYRNNNQRNFWWNQRAGRWDGILPTAKPPGSTASEWWMWHDLGGSNPKPVAAIDNKTGTTPDAYWDEDARILYAFFSRGNSGTSRFRRFQYDPTTDRYVEVSRSGGVAAPDMLRGGSRVTITKAPNGHLFAGVNYDNKLLISRSTDGGNSWPEPVAIKTTAISGEGHWVVFNAGGSTRVGFAATEDGLAPGGNPRVHFIHLDQNESDWANPARWTDETNQVSQWEGDERADDELSAVVFENRVFVVIETEPLGDARRNTRPQLIAFERQTNGQWRKHVIQRYTSKNTDDAKRPAVTVDASARLLVVTAGTTQRSYADMWYAPIDSLVGRDEQWSKLRIFQTTGSSQDIYNTRLPLPRFPVTAQSNLLTMIDDMGTAKNLWRQVVRSVTQNPDTTPPSVSITSPAGGATVSGTVPVAADASDDRGVASVEFFANGATIGRDTDGSDGWSTSWDTSSIRKASRTLTAVAHDQAGNATTSSPVQVNVDNPPSGPAEPVNLEIPIGDSADDAEERSNGRMWLTQTNLDFMTDVTNTGSDDQRAVGLRFSLPIPRGATITDAYVQFQANKATTVETNLSIAGHAADNAPAFSTTKFDLTSRPRTGAEIGWIPAAWTKKGHRNAEQRTPNLSPIIQQVVNRSAWDSGNALALIFEGSGERVAEAFDGGVHAPTLYVQYTAP